ncbi:hypothetical protein BCR36DRAFT_408073 [Piromyces finnis]|uniref:RGS domain-containing protein n=1 Tax=Piromyces finnis TaxID=1754191 RepID=A0A1Y1VPN9_9FUNG|nr:hypothetical protein BCR36DRAFT_408073 [Piromyces finnis]|eukprot:ORX61093.1 hypothetical protein BCR36DRAFT_408073 [Piromyces finnis]
MSSNIDLGSNNSSSNNGLPPPHVLAQLPLAARIDLLFTPNLLAESLIFLFFAIYYIPSLILYIKYREHRLIRYRQPKNVIIVGCICSAIGLSTPIIRYFKFICLINTWVINTLIFSLYIFTFSRYVRTFFLQRLSIFKLKFSEKKNSNMVNTSVKTCEISTKELEENVSSVKTSIKTNSVNKLSSSAYSKGTGNDSFSVIDPITYFKRLNLIINKYITIYLVIVPLLFLFIYSIAITIIYWDKMKVNCVNELKATSIPKLILNITIMTTSIYFFYQAYCKQKWDFEFRFEYTLFIAVVAICLTVMELTINGYTFDFMVQYRIYIFQFLSLALHASCIYEPLIKILLDNFKEKESKLTEEEFLMKFSNSNFKAQIKEIATNTFCIENVLFFDAHVDLMNMVISYYSKRNTIASADNTGYSSSDILHKSTINPVLYKPFDNIFKSKYEQIYNLYIKEDGIAAVNIKSSTIKAIEEQMENDNYSYLMFNQAAEEIGELLYNNIYLRMKN